jgi:hypothetical protein
MELIGKRHGENRIKKVFQFGSGGENHLSKESQRRTRMIKSLFCWLAIGSLAISAPAAAAANPVAMMLNPAGIAGKETAKKLPRCTKQRTTECRDDDDGIIFALFGGGLAVLAIIAASGGGGRTASP